MVINTSLFGTVLYNEMECKHSVVQRLKRLPQSRFRLTRSLLDEGVIVVEAAAGADGDVVESPGHQRVERTLRTGLGDGHGVQRPVAVAQRHQVAVHLTWGRTPRHAEEVRPTVVADSHLPDGSRD